MKGVQIVSAGVELWDVLNAAGENVGRIYRDGGRLVFNAGEGAMLTADDLWKIARVIRVARWRA